MAAPAADLAGWVSRGRRTFETRHRRRPASLTASTSTAAEISRIEGDIGFSRFRSDRAYLVNDSVSCSLGDAQTDEKAAERRSEFAGGGRDRETKTQLGFAATPSGVVGAEVAARHNNRYGYTSAGVVP